MWASLMHKLGLRARRQRPASFYVPSDVLAEYIFERCRNLADRGVVFGGLQDQRHQVGGALRGFLDSRKRLIHRRLTAAIAHFAQTGNLRLLERRVQLERGDSRAFRLKSIHAHNYLLAVFHCALEDVGGVLNLALNVARFNRA